MPPGSGGAAKVPSLPPPRPKSPPEYPDLYGKRRELARVQLIEREIGFLEVSSIMSSLISPFVFGLSFFWFDILGKRCDSSQDHLRPSNYLATLIRVHLSLSSSVC